MEMDTTETKAQSTLNLQVRFTTKQQQYAIPDYPFAVEAHIGTEELNTLVNRILNDDGTLEKDKRFDFLIGGEFLRGSLEELVLRHEARTATETGGEKGIGVEEIVEVEYLESCPPPEPKDCLMHDDWVSAVDANEKWILTGCYDNTLHLWSKKGKHKEAFVGHTGPVKAVSWVSMDSDQAVFASGSQDQTMMIWQWDFASNNVACKWVCKGHERSVESLKGDPTATLIATGGWDGMLKLWSASPSIEKTDVKVLEAQSAEDEGQDKVKTRTPILTLGGHREGVSGMDWIDPSELITSSWDHTIKTWDVEMGGMKEEISGQKAFFCLSYSQLNRLVITGSADRHIRLYDPRSNEGSIVKTTFTSHSGWVSFVDWSKTDENLFVSGCHDQIVKLWDRRSPRAPLFNMSGHTDKILCGTWANPKFMMSGGADNSLRLYNFKRA